MKLWNKLLFILFFAAVLLPVAFLVAQAKEIHLQWDANPEPDIQCYRVYMGTQVDMTTWTWEQVGEVTAPTAELVYDVPSRELRLFMVGACDQAGHESIRYNAGVFSCTNWEPPGKPGGVGIE